MYNFKSNGDNYLWSKNRDSGAAAVDLAVVAPLPSAAQSGSENVSYL